jgi:hypothetical protein
MASQRLLLNISVYRLDSMSFVAFGRPVAKSSRITMLLTGITSDPRSAPAQATLSTVGLGYGGTVGATALSSGR